MQNEVHCANIFLWTNYKEWNEMAKKKIDKQKLAGRILAGVLAGMMVVGGCATLLWQIFAR